MELSNDDRRAIGSWAADCAERVLPLFEARAPDDVRPREAIEAARAFARGGKRTAKLRTLALAALAAAREVDDPAATPAARAAGLAASSAYTHALATLDQAKHVLGPAVYAAMAREFSSGEGPDAGDEEIRWAIGHASQEVRKIVRRFPARRPGRTRLDVLYHQLDAGVRLKREWTSRGGTPRDMKRPNAPTSKYRTRLRRVLALIQRDEVVAASDLLDKLMQDVEQFRAFALSDAFPAFRAAVAAHERYLRTCIRSAEANINVLGFIKNDLRSKPWLASRSTSRSATGR